jgi:hypothetical protein
MVSSDRTVLHIQASSDMRYGVAATLDAWDGQEWEPRYWLNTPASVRGSYSPIDKPLRVNLVSFGGSRDLALTLPELAPGWYRIRKTFKAPPDGSRVEAEALFEVRSGE